MQIYKILFIIIALLSGVEVSCADDDISKMRVLEIPLLSSDTIDLSGFVDVALFDNEALSLNDILDEQALFEPLEGHDINLGFVRTSAWMRFAVTLPPEAEQSQNLILSIMPNFTDELDVFVTAQKSGLSVADFMRYQMGDHLPRSLANLNTSANIVPIMLHPGQTTIVYIHARNQDASLNVSVKLLSPPYYQYRSIIQNIGRGMWFGGMGILLIIQLFFFYFDRKKFYIFLALYILSVACIYFGSLGLARLLLFNDGGLGNDYFSSMSSWFGLTAGALCISAILDLHSRHPRINLYFYFATVVGIAGVICVFFGVNRYFVLVAGPVILVLTTLSMLVSLIDLKRAPDAQTGLNFAAFGLLWAGLMATNGQRYGVFPLPTWVAESYAATSIVHFTLLTGSLAVRLRNAENLARSADRRALETANAAEQHANDLVLVRTRELEEAKRVAENALRAELLAQEEQVRFMEVISHQYRTPLGVIRTNLHSIRLTLPKDDEPNRRRLDQAHVGITRLVEVIEVNLTRSKVQGLAYKPSFLDISLGEVVANSVTSARDLLHGVTLNVSMTTDAKHAIIRADSEMLHLAIINLLDNAFKFSVPLKSSLVWLNVYCERDEVFLCVKDKGVGIGSDTVEYLLRKNTRGCNSKHIEGTGVGLSIVKRTTDAHGGRFSLLGCHDGGTEATIVLPILN